MNRKLADDFADCYEKGFRDCLETLIESQLEPESMTPQAREVLIDGAREIFRGNLMAAALDAAQRKKL